MLQCKN